ncbi:ROK family protein [Algicella marina]|uniref:ROK family protein n=2 Tax=Algicella marina TaxID=2683284 RepID=A0A6P1T7U1_9RHOB|nr:ROK family protein [Algicella marina]
MAAMRSAPEIARVDISRQTGLSPATVTAVTSELILAGLIEDAPGVTGPTRRGRPRVNLRIRGCAHRVIGAKLADRTITTAVLDFAGKTLAEAEYPIPGGGMSPDRVATYVAKAVQDACGKAEMRLEEISGICLGVAGFVDGPRGLVHWSRAFDRRDVRLTELLSRHFACPVFVENDANLIAMAELWFGMGREKRDFVTVTLENGLGMGIVIDRKLYRGSRRRGAELGHTKVALDGALCSCGQRGCLEAYVAEYALLREANLVLDAGQRLGDAGARMDALYAEARGGNARALEIFRRAGRMFGLGLANVVNIFDPSLIVLSGTAMRYEYLYDEAVMAEMRANIIKVDDAPPDVRVHEWGDVLWAKGAAALALEGITELALASLGQPRSAAE